MFRGSTNNNLRMRKVKTFLFLDTLRGDEDLISIPMDKKVCMMFKISFNIHINPKGIGGTPPVKFLADNF